MICEGPAELVERPGEGLLAAARRQPRDLSWATWWIRLTPEKVFSYGGGKDG